MEESLTFPNCHNLNEFSEDYFLSIKKKLFFVLTIVHLKISKGGFQVPPQQCETCDTFSDAFFKRRGIKSAAD